MKYLANTLLTLGVMHYMMTGIEKKLNLWELAGFGSVLIIMWAAVIVLNNND